MVDYRACDEIITPSCRLDIAISPNVGVGAGGNWAIGRLFT